MEIQKSPLTPLMQQYWEIKNQHLDKILLFRMGDFYEMFFEDAVKAAPLLNIALTSRNKSQGIDVPMCGVPHHSIGPQINKLLQAQLKVAICDQIENPKDAKTIVKRAVVRIVTPGLAYDPDTILGSKSLFVASFAEKGEGLYDFAAVDASTGEVRTASALSLSELSSWVEKLAPQEFILSEKANMSFVANTVVTLRAREPAQSIENFLLKYVEETQGSEVVKTLRPAENLETDFLKISPTTMRHLEIFKSSTDDTHGSLFETLNLTKSAMGSRLLKKRFATPFLALSSIEAELDQVSNYVADEVKRRAVRERLLKVGDLERRVAKLSNPLCNARDLQALGRSLEIAFEIFEIVSAAEDVAPESSPMSRCAEKIRATLQDELPHSTKEGKLIRPGFNSALDEFVDLATHAQEKLTALEAREREATGIQSLKVKYNSVFGYSFEVTKSNLDRVPQRFIRKQTLAQAERFVTVDLVDLEEKILSSQQKRCELEFEIFDELRKKILNEARTFLNAAGRLAHIDVQSSFAQLAVEQNYCRPHFCEAGLFITGSRHPVIEKISREIFVPNDVEIKKGECLLLTGPNMAGKSTLMRQVVLTVILAQCGSFVPATSARLPLFDQVFTRIGASDHLVKGLSTFMVEMTETAEIIHSATANSLVILDEIGRGTSTYDGMSLAQAVLEYFVSHVGSYTLFATHYHELTELEKELPLLTNFHMSIEEHKGALIFLRRLTRGSASRSYGIEVAKEAGLPLVLTRRAQEILKGITSKTKELRNRQLDLLSHFDDATQSDESQIGENDLALDPEKSARLEKLEKLFAELSQVAVNELTPLGALNHLAQIQKSFS